MCLTKHANILAALEIRALRYHNKGQANVYQDDILYNEAMDETGTLNTTGLSDSDVDSLGGTILEKLNSNNFRTGGNHGDRR